MIVTAFLLAAVPAARARGIGYIPTSAALFAQSVLVCNGQVLDVTRCGPDEVHVYAGGQKEDYAETWMLARVKILHVFKGTAPAEITVRYRTSQPNTLLMDGPMHMNLAAGERYHFFLKAGPRPNDYLDVLDGRIDDQFALKTLLPDESDRSPAMTDGEAKQIALDYLKAKRPVVSYALQSAAVFPETSADCVTFAPSAQPAEQILIVVLNDRTVDEKASRIR